MALTTLATAALLSSALGAWYVTGSTAELGNWNPVDGVLMADDGVPPDEVANDNIFTAQVTFTVPDSQLVEYKIADGDSIWYGGTNGQNMQLSLVGTPDDVIFYLDLNDRSGEGWHPQAGWSLSDDHLAGNYTWVAVGTFQDEAGEAGEWIPTSTVTVMHDDGQNGDRVAGDGIYSFQFTPATDLVGDLWKVVRQGDWAGSIKFGANGWSFDPNDSWNLTLNANAGYTVLLEFDARHGWMRQTVTGAPMTTTILSHDVSVARGDVFHMVVQVNNQENAPTTGDVWVDAILPNGSPAPANPVAGPVTLTLPPLGVVSGPVALPVPMVAPTGDYQILTRTGIHGAEIWDTQQVTVTVTP